MSRDLPSALLANTSDDVIYPFFAVELLFDDDNALRLWTGQGTLTYDGNDWFGTGILLDVSAIEETSEIAVRGASLTLSGVPSEVISLAITQPYQGRKCNIYFGLVDKSAGAATGEVTLSYGEVNLTEIFTGYMDQMDIQEGPDSSTIELKVENRLIDLERARVARFTSGYQKSVYPNDLGLDFVESLQNRPVSWGKATT